MKKNISFTCFFIVLFYLISNYSVAQVSPEVNSLSIDISTFPQDSSFNYDSCFNAGKEIGISSVGLFQNWTAVEIAPGTFDLRVFDAANYYYPLHNISVDLKLVPIHTNNLEVPSDLVSVAFNDQVFINRFKTLLDSVKSHLPDLTLSSLVIGSEHDVYLGTDSTLWKHYTEFYDSVSAYARTLWPDIKIASELTYSGITEKNDLAQKLNLSSDYIGVSYYPLDENFAVKSPSVIYSDFSELISLYPSEKIIFYQFGYPSSSICNSSEVLQAEFVSTAFSAWDMYAGNIKMINFTWLHDLDSVQVSYYGSYYGLNNNAFLEFLRTLGLRTWNLNGTDKLAINVLRCEAKKRGFNDLNVSCDVRNKEVIEEHDFQIVPNPSTDNIKISLAPEIHKATIEITDTEGRISKRFFIEDLSLINVSVADLQPGVYTVRILSDHKQITKKIIIEAAR